MKLIDSHAHLEFSQFDADREAVIARAQAAGVATILAIGSGSGPDRLEVGIRFAEKYTWMYASIGIHPHEARLATEEHFARLRELTQHPKVIAWGEIGLDYHYDHSPRDTQIAVFRWQLELAREAGLPVIIHCREAWTDCLEILESEWKPTGRGGILHCFSGTLTEAARALAMGFMISFAGNLSYPKAANLREVAQALPAERILIETDSPFLAPQAYRGKRNEPAYVVEVARKLAEVRGVGVEEAAELTTGNFRRFFGLDGTRQ